MNPFHDGVFDLLKALSFQHSLLLQLKLHFFKSCIIHVVVSIFDTHFLKSLCSIYECPTFGGKKRFGGEFGIHNENHFKDSFNG